MLAARPRAGRLIKRCPAGEAADGAAHHARRAGCLPGDLLLLDMEGITYLMTKVTLQRKLVMALSRMFVDEWRLLSVRLPRGRQAVSERAVAFQLGWYLRPLLDRMWDVDCEYNRSGAGDKADIKRAASHARSPDLIVHRRGDENRTGNLLVLELKTNTDEQHHDGGNIESVRSLMLEHEYQHGVFLDLRISHSGPQTTVSPEWIWLEAPAPPVPPAKERVYKQAANLEALMKRGREEEIRRYSYFEVSNTDSEIA